METLRAQWKFFVNQWAASPEAANVFWSERDLKLINLSLEDAIKRGVFPTPDEWRKILENVQGGNSGGDDDGIPYIDEPLLRTIISMEAVRQMTATQLQMVSSLWPYDSNGNTVVPIGGKFKARLAWLKEHSDISPEAVAEAINRALGGNEPQKPQTVVVRKVEDPRIQVIRSRIETELKGYTNWSLKKRESLNRMLNELISDPSRQVYRDRSRGGIEVLKGLDAIERLMSDAIRDADNPIR